MKSKETKKATIEALEEMICQADKGPSGFWTEDCEGCGNPKIFPEFEEGLKRGKLVYKEHYLCPWNKAVLYGKGHGNIQTGCYYSCSIDKARYLSEEMLKAALIRFKERLINGMYDHTDYLQPLLTSDEISYIENQIHTAEELKKEQNRAKRNARLKSAAALIKKHPDKKDLFALYYGEKVLASTYDGVIDFSPDGYKDIVGAEKFTYDDYIDVQIKSFHKTKGWAEACYHNIPMGFKGCIERKTKDRICFKRIAVDAMYSDGICYDDRGEHVWMSIAGFEEYQVGDCVSFFADVYRYVKTGNGKQIDYALRNPEGIEKIEAYHLPTDEELTAQEINEIICESCYLNEQCNGIYCMLADNSCISDFEQGR